MHRAHYEAMCNNAMLYKLTPTQASTVTQAEPYLFCSCFSSRGMHREAHNIGALTTLWNALWTLVCSQPNSTGVLSKE